jgi:hypothetical protein
MNENSGRWDSRHIRVVCRKFDTGDCATLADLQETVADHPGKLRLASLARIASRIYA